MLHSLRACCQAISYPMQPESAASLAVLRTGKRALRNCFLPCVNVGDWATPPQQLRQDLMRQWPEADCSLSRQLQASSCSQAQVKPTFNPFHMILFRWCLLPRSSPELG